MIIKNADINKEVFLNSEKTNTFIVLVLLFFVPVFSQFSSKQQISFYVIQNSQKVNVGSKLDVAFKLDTYNTWYINSNNPKDKSLFPTTIKLKSEQFKFSDLVFPHPEEIKFEFSEKSIAVYKGIVYVYGKIFFDEKLELKEYKIPVEIKYQSCNNTQFLYPNTITAEIVVTTVEAGEAVTKINNEVFEYKNADSEPDPVAESSKKISEFEGDKTAAELLESGLFFSLIILLLFGLALMTCKREVFRKFKTIIGLVILLLVFMLTYSCVSSSSSVEKVKFEKFGKEKFEVSLKKGKKILLDFYADWCIPCKEYDAVTFKDPKVVSLSKSFDNYKIDMTKSDDYKEALSKKFGAKVMPTLIIFDTTGKEVKRLTGYVGPEELVKILKSVN